VPQRMMKTGRRPAIAAGLLWLIGTAAAGLGAEAGGAAAVSRSQAGAAELSLMAGFALFCGLAGLFCVHQRRRFATLEAARDLEFADLRAKLGRAEAFLGAEPQIHITWGGAGQEPDIAGDRALMGSGPDLRQVLEFHSWLAPSAAKEAEDCVAQLRTCGKRFRLSACTLSGRSIEIDGRPSAGLAVLRIRDVSSERLESLRLQEALAAASAELRALRALLDALPSPAWLRDDSGKLTWVNAAYARAVEAHDQEAAVAKGLELIEEKAREESAGARASATVWRGRAPAVVAGERRVFEAVDVPSNPGSAGMAIDTSEISSLRSALDQQAQAHARTLDQLSTAVAIFDGAKQLVFYNAAYRQLWQLEQAWLDQKPTDPEILDRLRAARMLPEQADFRAWKAGLLSAYQSLESDYQDWFLPDGRTLRVAINPNPQGGVTYLFDDVSERYRLASQFNASMRVQTETLDALKEGVAVFGSDGRLKFFNPAFAALWALDPEALSGEPHIGHVAELCAPLHADEETWRVLRASVAALPDQRLRVERRLERPGGPVLDCAGAPLPDGATLLTFVDVTASVNVERALKERNQALMDIERLRNDFIHHISYELRSPLTNIIGFIQFLADPATGPLNSKQREYLGYVSKSSSALLAIINDILDLATIDADAMDLALEDVDIAATMRAAAEGVQDRLSESALTLRVQADDELGSFVADGKRIRQILFNLLSNAIRFSSPGQTVDLAASRQDGEIRFCVSDEGSGIPQDILEQVFGRSKAREGTGHFGAGLGLSIVRSFVELHGGRVEIDSVPGKGTRAVCIFPAQSRKAAPTRELEGVQA